MKHLILRFVLLLITTHAFSQSSVSTTPPSASGNSATAKPGDAAEEAVVNIKWLGPGAVNLVFNKKKYFFTEGQQQALNFKSGAPYTLKAEKPHSTYDYNDFLAFEKGQQYYIISLDSNDVRVEKTVSPEQKLINEKITIANIANNMVKVTGGTYTMGCATCELSNDSGNAENYEHNVTVSGFSICKYDVTQEEYEAVMGDNPSNFKNCPKCPVESVSWDDAMAFIKKLNELTGKNYRLPTEAEWEYAAKGANKTYGKNKYSGSNDVDAVAWYDANSGKTTHPVGKKQDNELGLYDMSGNVWQWCSDWYEANYYADSPATNPKGAATGSEHIVRGGSWYRGAQNCRITHRSWLKPDGKRPYLGFRLAMDI